MQIGPSFHPFAAARAPSAHLLHERLLNFRCCPLSFNIGAMFFSFSLPFFFPRPSINRRGYHGSSAALWHWHGIINHYASRMTLLDSQPPLSLSILFKVTTTREIGSAFRITFYLKKQKSNRRWSALIGIRSRAMMERAADCGGSPNK